MIHSNGPASIRTGQRTGCRHSLARDPVFPMTRPQTQASLFGTRTWPLLYLCAFVVLVLSVGCVRRTLTITTEPPNARVFLNDQEIGRTRVSTDFTWYGDYDVVIRKEGYKTVQTHWKIDAPWYQIVPLDFFVEVLWPWDVHDSRERHFVLEPQEIPTVEEVVQRAEETREQAYQAGQ
jgi:hypothetical protein